MRSSSIAGSLRASTAATRLSARLGSTAHETIQRMRNRCAVFLASVVVTAEGRRLGGACNSSRVMCQRTALLPPLLHSRRGGRALAAGPTSPASRSRVALSWELRATRPHPVPTAVAPATCRSASCRRRGVLLSQPRANPQATGESGRQHRGQSGGAKRSGPHGGGREVQRMVRVPWPPVGVLSCRKVSSPRRGPRRRQWVRDPQR